MKGSEAVVTSLINEGVEYYFMVNAERIIGLNVISELSGRLKFINATFEPGAGFMSLVYARVTGKAGVNIFVGGPGVLGAVSPVTMAHIESDPLVVITVTPPRSIAYKNAHHALFNDSDQLNVFRSITKKQFKVTCVTQLPHIISRAFYEALSNRPGPVYIEIPADLLDENLSEFNYVKLNLSKVAPLDSEVNEVFKILKKAEKPVIIVGRGVTIANAESELLTLAELLDIPVCTTIMGKGIVSPKHPLYGGLAAGRIGDDVANELVSKADVILAIGVRFSELSVGRYSMKINGKLIHVLVSSEEIGRVFKPDLAIVADAKEFLRKLLRLIDNEKLIIKRGSNEFLNSMWNKFARESQQHLIGTDLIEPYDVVKVLRENFDEDCIFVSDVGAVRFDMFTMPIYKPRTYITTTSYGSMGIAVPGAIAAKLAKKDSYAIGVVGDGGFLMTGLEVATGVRYNIPAIIVVFNDSSYRVLRIFEKRSYGTELTHKLPNVNFSELAKSLGAHGLRIERKDELKEGINKALSLAKDKPVVIDVLINPDAIPRPLAKLYGIK